VFKWYYKLGFGFKVHIMVHVLSNLNHIYEEIQKVKYQNYKHVSCHIKQWQDNVEPKIKIFLELKPEKKWKKPVSGMVM
jgi:hypothetical protein